MQFGIRLPINFAATSAFDLPISDLLEKQINTSKEFLNS